MDEIGSIKLETDRLILRRFTIEDAESIYRNWAMDKDIMSYINRPAHNSLEDSIGTLREWVANYNNPDFFQWAVTLKGQDEPIGCISGMDYNPNLKFVTLDYCIAREYWNKGLMTEGLREVVRYLFEDVKINRIEGRHTKENIAPGRVMENSFMRYEYTLKGNKSFKDTRIYSVLKREYDDRKQRNLDLV